MNPIYLSLLFPILVFSQNTIQIDGFFADWNTDVSTYIDDSFDSDGVDLLDFSVCHDDEYLYVKIGPDMVIFDRKFSFIR